MNCSQSDATLAEYLLARLKSLGVQDVFGVAGDYVLNFLNAVVAEPGIDFHSCSSELNAAYATDGYARVVGFGCVAVTFGVGEFSALNGIALSASEAVPMLVLVGMPQVSLLDNQSKRVHHSVHSPLTGMNVFKQICVDAHVIESVDERTPNDIDKLLIRAIKHSGPVYLGVPTDLLNVRMPLPAVIPKIDPFFEYESDEDALRTVVELVIARLSGSKSPVILLGREVCQKKLSDAVLSLINCGDIQFTTMKFVKDAVDESHSLYIGNISDCIKEIGIGSDLKILVGVRLNDVNTFGMQDLFQDESTIRIAADGVSFGPRVFRNVNWISVVKQLEMRKNELVEHCQRTKFPSGADYCTNCVPMVNTSLKMDRVVKLLEAVLPLSNTAWIYDVGSASMDCMRMRHGTNCLSVNQDHYLSIGYSLPAAYGVGVVRARQGSGQTHLVCICGDGGFQMTANELANVLSIKSENLNILVVVINNNGYSVERAIFDNVYNDICQWKYSLLAEAMGCCMSSVVSVCVKTEEELLTVLSKDKRSSRMFVEVIVDKWDMSQEVLTLGEAMRSANAIVTQQPKHLVDQQAATKIISSDHLVAEEHPGTTQQQNDILLLQPQ